MNVTKTDISWRQFAELQRAMIPPHAVLQVSECENCGHALFHHYNRFHIVMRVACLEGKCKCSGIKIGGKVIDEFESSEKEKGIDI